MAVPRSESAIGWCPPARSMIARRVFASVQPGKASIPRSSGPRRFNVPMPRSIAASVSLPLAVMPRMPHMGERLAQPRFLSACPWLPGPCLSINWHAIGRADRDGTMTRPLSEYNLADWRRLRPITHGIKTLRYRAVDRVYRRQPARAGDPAALARAIAGRQLLTTIAFADPEAIDWQGRLVGHYLPRPVHLIADNSPEDASAAAI